jgi:hypothetical protein
MSIPNTEMEFTKNYTTNNMFRTYFTGTNDTDTTNKKKQKKVNNSLRLFAWCHEDQLCSLGDMWGSNSSSSHHKQYDVETVNDDYESSSSYYEEDKKVDDSIESAIQRHNQRKDHSLTQKFVAQSKPKQTSVVHTSISTAATAVIQNTTLRHAATAAAAAAMEETKMEETKMDEAQRALDWIQDPQSHKGSLMTDSCSSSNSILAVPSPTESQPQHQQEENKQDNVPQTHAEFTCDPSKHQVEEKDEDEHDPNADVAFSYWKKVDQKVTAQKHQLQQKHQLETQTLQHQNQEQESLLQSRLQTMFPNFVAATPSQVVIAPDRSDIEFEQQELEEEQQREFDQKEAELELLQSAIHKRLTPSMPNNDTSTTTSATTSTTNTSSTETNNTRTRLERKLEGGKSPNVGTPPNKVEEHAEPEESVQEQEPTTTTYSSLEHVQVQQEKVDDTRVPPLPQSLEDAVAPKAESSEEHKQHMLESPDRDNAHSLRPNQRLRPIQCKIELPKEPRRDAEKEKRLAEEKQLRDQFKAARLKALMEQQNSFSTLDDLSAATPSSAKTTETSQTTQTTQTTSSSRASSVPPTIRQLPPRRRRGESAKLAAKRKELEWKWNSAKKPIQDLERKELAKLAQTNKFPTTKQEQERDGKWLMDYKPLVEEQLQLPSGTPPKQKVWSKKKPGTMTTTITPTTTAASAPTIVSIDDNDGESPKSRLSELVERQRAMQARHQKRKITQGKWENRNNDKSTASSAQSPPPAVAQTPPGPSMSSVNQQQQQQQQEEAKASTVITPERELASGFNTRVSGNLEQQRSKDLEGKAVVTPERQLKASRPGVTGFWEQKRSNEDSKQRRKDMQEKWNVGVQGKSSPSQEEDKPVSKIEAKRRELAEKRKEFERLKREASNRLEQEMLGYPDAEEEAKAPAVDTKHLVGQFEGLRTRSTSKNTANTTTKPESPLPLDGSGHIYKCPPSRQMADWKQKELDRRNTEYQTYLPQFDRTKSHEVASSIAWPDLECGPQTPLPTQIRTVDEARSDHSVPEKDVTRKQQLRRAWRHRAWKAIDKVDHVGKDRQSKELGTAAVQLVMENSSKYAMQTEQF